MLFGVIANATEILLIFNNYILCLENYVGKKVRNITRVTV
jgi:hypothetical protein